VIEQSSDRGYCMMIDGENVITIQLVENRKLSLRGLGSSPRDKSIWTSKRRVSYRRVKQKL
jgi:hypothetical protein